MMWREEAGIMEMMFSYISEYQGFFEWSSWRGVVVEILSCHEEMRRQRSSSVFVSEGDLLWKDVEPQMEQKQDDDPLLSVDPELLGPHRRIPNLGPHREKDTLKSDNGKGGDGGGTSEDSRGAPEDEAQNPGVVKSEESGSQSNVNVKYPEDVMMMIKRETTDDAEVRPDCRPIDEQIWMAEEFQAAEEFSSLTAESSSSSFSPYPVSSSATKGWTGFSVRPPNMRMMGRYVGRSRGRPYHNQTGPLPYVCPTCGKSFSYKNTLQRHMIVHSGERPFVCSICGNSFFRKDYLISHMKTHR